MIGVLIGAIVFLWGLVAALEELSVTADTHHAPRWKEGRKPHD